MINLIPCVDVDETLEECADHVASEYKEFKNAYTDYLGNPDGKNRGNMVEEAIDCANSLITFVAKATNNRQDVALMLVACKNYLRGYHNENPIALIEMGDINRNRMRDLEFIEPKNEK